MLMLTAELRALGSGFWYAAVDHLHTDAAYT